MFAPSIAIPQVGRRPMPRSSRKVAVLVAQVGLFAVFAVAGTVFFGLFSKVGDYRMAIVFAGFLFLPAAGFAWLLPEAPEERMS